MNITEIIKSRYSCRTFIQTALKPADKETLENFIIENSKGFENEVVNFRIFEKNDADKQLKLNYGMIQGHNTYVLGTSKSSTDSRVNYGYLLEWKKLFLKPLKWAFQHAGLVTLITVTLMKYPLKTVLKYPV